MLRQAGTPELTWLHLSSIPHPDADLTLRERLQAIYAASNNAT
jgi:hypothetical protein